MLAAIVVLHWVVISSFPHWWGGHSFGNRLFADMLPYFVHFMIPAVAALPGLPGPARPRRAGRDADVDQQPARIWDWRDLQALRGLRGLPAPIAEGRRPSP